MIQYEWSVGESDHLEIVDSDEVDVILLRGICSHEDIRAMRRLVIATLGRLGSAQDGDHVTKSGLAYKK